MYNARIIETDKKETTYKGETDIHQKKICSCLQEFINDRIEARRVLETFLIIRIWPQL